MIENLQYFNILYVDDEVHNLNSFKAAFRRTFKVFTAESASVARELLDANEIHLIITDQRMPATTGTEFLESIMKDHPDPVRILLTGYADINAVVDAINKGKVFKYIQKPWDEEQLKQTITEGLELYVFNKKKREIAQLLEENNRQMEFLLRQSLLS